MLKNNLKLVAFTTSLLAASTVKADLYHYNNLLVGDRAIGLGGAFTAISDDASGVYYNPAGLGFALNNDISGSANARFTKETTFKEVVPGTDYVEKSEGSVAPFVGGLQKLDNIASGLVFAFALYNTNNELINQNDQIDITNSSGVTTLFFDRKVQYKSEDFNVGVGLGYRISNDSSVGLSITMASAYELYQDYQFVGQIASSSSNLLFSYRNQNIRNELNATGVEVGFGFQANIVTGLVAGISVKSGSMLTQTYTQNQNVTQTIIDSGSTDCSSTDCQILLGDLKGESSSVTAGTVTSHDVSISEVELDDVLSASLPLKARLGLAYFASPKLLFSFDAAYNGESKSEDEYGIYDKEAVTDFHAGAEFYVTPSIPMRLGVFTSNDNRPEVTKAGDVHIDYTGASLFGSWVQPNSQLGLGVTYQLGTGKAMKLDSGNAVQDVESYSIVYALSAAHSF